jgi:competence ComEA-like helix-hairpin-helix protein
MNKIFLLFCLIFLINIISSQCSENQININTATANDLDKLSGIGPVYAQKIIESRPFESVDKLIDVNGIGPATLEKIKSQGLACVSEEKSSEEKTELKIIENKSNTLVEEKIPEKFIEKEIHTIDLTGNSVENNSQKDIKINNVKDGLNKKAVYGLAGFCILLGVLFLIKNRKRKNEFR